MKKTNIKINKRKLVARVMLLVLLLASVLNFSGCVEDPTATNDRKDNVSNLEYGLEFEFVRGPMIAPGRTAYKSDKTEFDIDDVTLTFYYGELFLLKTDGSIYTDIETMTIPYFDLYFCNDEGDEYLIRHVEEEWISIKHYVSSRSVEYEEDGQKRFKTFFDFSHSEDITIPAKLFTKENGYISFHISTTHYPGQLLMGVSPSIIYYQRVGNKVVLSSEEFK